MAERLSRVPATAMVLAAGLGKRMRPLTDSLPKPLIPVGGRTLIDRSLDWLAEAGVASAAVNTCYLAEILEQHLSVRGHPRILISREEEPLETGGGIFKALPLLGAEPFIVVNSDSLCVDAARPALARLAERWDGGAMDALLLVQPVEKAFGYSGPGDFDIGPAGEIRRRAEGERVPYVFTGVQILHPRLFTDCPPGPFSMNLLYNRRMDAQRRLPNVFALPHDGEWLHVGDLEGLRQAEGFFADFLPP